MGRRTRKKIPIEFKVHYTDTPCPPHLYEAGLRAYANMLIRYYFEQQKKENTKPTPAIELADPEGW